jgi:hypothetical protein
MYLHAQRWMLRGMNKLSTLLVAVAAVCLLVLPAVASAAKPVRYVGKTSGGHKVTFELIRGKKVDDFETGIPVQCLPIQGGGNPMSGVDVWPNSYFPVNRTVKFQAMLVPAFYWNEVTNNFEVTTKKLRTGAIRGHLRKQYEFLVPKYTPGTFTIYSCLGEATFRAKPVR